MQVYTETCAKRCREQTAAGGGSHERERIEVYLYRACRRTFVYHYINAIVFHCRVQIFFDNRRQTVYLVDEQHIARLERCKYAGQIAGLIEHRTAGELESHAQLVGNDIAQSGLSQSRRTVQQRMVERLAAIFGSLDKHFKVLHHLLLTAEVGEAQRTQCVLELLFAQDRTFLPYVKIVCHYNRCRLMMYAE